MSNDQNFRDLDERAHVAADDLTSRAAARPAPAFDPDRPATVPLSAVPLRRPPTRRPLFAVAAAAVVALLATAVWFGTKGDDTDVADDVVTGSIQPYLPAVVPDGMELAGVGETDGTVEPDPSFADDVGPLQTFGPETDDPRIGVLVFGGGFMQEEPSGRSVAVGDRTGYVTDDSPIGAIALEVAVNPGQDGPSLVLVGRGIDEDALIDLAAATTVDGLEATVPPAALPDGWRLLDTDPDGLGAASPMGPLRGGISGRSTIGYYFDPAAPQRTVVVSSLAQPAAAIHTQRLFLQEVEMVTVRGHDALIGRFPPAATGGDSWSVRWEERPGEVIAVAGMGVTRDELLAAAESLQPVDVTRWKELLEATALGDLRPYFDEQRSSVELGRGRFADGTAWVLRYSPEQTSDEGTSAENLDLTVALVGDSSRSSGSSSFSQTGTAIDQDGDVIDAPAEVFRTTTSLEQGGRAFAAGLVRDDVARVEHRSTDGTTVEAHMVTAEGQVAWVVELREEVTTVVAFAADGTELGSQELGAFEDGTMSHGPASTIVEPGTGGSSDSGSGGADGRSTDGGSEVAPSPTTSGG